ncbi:hypothetical protein HNR46_001146 [Haloferula luteola]|uniref:Uncharacterized protein n=1 Tax=Haloferula luteola TaxID=595692 RepID=A0A840UYQ5_9BACT|nr:hypothetical protein [Haloferula luteola]MBB5350912.1 hypothetical protein [Haloferula luteola]
MKPSPWIFPVMALGVVVAWTGSRQVKIQHLRDQTQLIRQHLSHVESLPEAEQRGTSPSADSVDKDAPLDWKELGATMRSMRGNGPPDIRAMLKIQQLLTSMDVDQLLAEFERLDDIELDDDIRSMVKESLGSILIQKDPQLALNHLLHLSDQEGSSLGWQLSRAFQEWSEKDPQQALAWLDTKVAEGEFDSKSLDGRNFNRIFFESVAISRLLESDPAAATARMMELPENQRREIFQNGKFAALKPELDASYAGMVRDSLPEDQQAGVLAWAGEELARQQGFERVSQFLDTIDASSEETVEVAKRAAQGQLRIHQGRSVPDRNEVDSMRSWLTQEVPEKVDEITGETLAKLWGTDFEERVDLVESLRDDGASDDLLVAFLVSGEARQYPESARELARGITDESRRNEVLRRFPDFEKGEGQDSDSNDNP